jgi:S1-C subfamily serine protease
MGSQRLLLAIALLAVTRIFTFIAPLPAINLDGEAPGSQASGSQEKENTQPEIPESIALEKAPQIRSERPPVSSTKSDSAPDRSQPNFSSSPLSPPASARSDRNPVQDRIDTSASTNPCENAGSAVVTIYAGREIGSGSIVSADGLVITNNHVVRRLQERDLYITTLEGDRYGGRVVATDQRHDLALLQLDTRNNLPLVAFSAQGTAQVGATVCAIGSPFGKAGVITQGKVTRILSNGDLESDVVLKPGNSGGPLLNSQGEMVGVNKGVARSRAENGDRASYTTPAAIAQELIRQNRPPAASVVPRIR